MKNTLLILILFAAGMLNNRIAAQTVILKTDTVEVVCTSTAAFLVPVRVRDFTNIAGLQFSMQWNAANLDYTYVTQLNPAFQGVGFDTSATLTNQGRLTFTWTGLNAVTLPPDAVVFSIGFTRIGGGATPVTASGAPTPIAVFDGDLNELSFQVRPGLVEVFDDKPPLITCPANATAEGTGATAVPGIAPASVSDNCGTPSVGWSVSGATTGSFPNDSDASGGLFSLGTSTVTYTATDAGNNTNTCSFTVTVNFAVTTGDLTLVAAGIESGCGQQVSIDVTAFNFDAVSGLQFSNNWNPAALQFVNVSDFNPALNLTTSNFLNSTGALSFSWSSLNGVTLGDGEVLFRLNFNVLGASAVSFSNNPTFITAFAGDPAEEVSVVTTNGGLTVVDQTPPTIACPANVTVEAPGTATVPNIAPANLSDNCAAPNVGWVATGATTASFPNDPDASGGLFNQGVSTVTYTATDAGNNTATCSFTVTVNFGITTTDLAVVVNGATAACNEPFSLDVTTLNFDAVSGLQFSVNWNPALYQYVSVSNLNGDLALTSTDNFLTGNGTLSFTWSGLNAVTLNDGALLFRINFNLIGNASSTVSITNNPTFITAFAGNPVEEVPVASFNGQVTVQDNVAPTITCPASTTVAAPSGSTTAAVSGLAPTMQDNCGGTPTLSFVRTGATPGNGTGNANGTYNAGTTTVTYTATDAAGNSATCSFQVVVTAESALVLTLDTIEADCQGAAQVIVNLTSENFTDIFGLTFNITWDPAVLSLVQPVTNVYPGFGIATSVIYTGAPSGVLVFVGSSPSWPDIPTGETMFSLVFNVLNPDGTSNLSFVGPFDAVNTSLQPVAVLTNEGYFSANADNSPPTLICPTNLPTLNTSPNQCSALYTPPLPQASDDCSGVASVMVSPTGNVFNVGSTTVTYTATDSAGNASQCQFVVTVEDNTPPTIICPTGVVANAGADACSAIVTFNLPVSDNCDQNLTLMCDHNSGDLFPVGVTSVTCVVEDDAENSALCQFNVTVLDVTAPTIANCPTDTLTFAAVDCFATAIFGPLVPSDNCDQDIEMVCSHNSGDNFPTGHTTVTCVAIDNFSNTAQCQFVVNVVDATAPSVICPPNDTVDVAQNACTANVTWTLPVASDDCDDAVELSTDTPSGSPFPAGTATVEYTATDNSGNTATCAFTVTVLETTPPVLVGCPAAILIELPANDCDSTITWTSPTATDNCGQATLTSNLLPNTLFLAGDTTVTYTATDAAGNEAVCSFTVTLLDKIAPVFQSCPPNQTLMSNGNCGAVPNWTFPTATDNCGIPDVTSLYQPGDTFIVGTTNVVILATDNSNNQDTCAFTIVVMGLPPGFTGIPTVAPLTGCTSTATWQAPTPVGFCGDVVLTSNFEPGDTFPQGQTTVIYTATDGNTTLTASFVVTVTENTPPQINCPQGNVQVNVGGVVIADPGEFIVDADTVNGCASVRLTLAPVLATDNCTPPEVTQTAGPNSGATFPIGMSTLTYLATDAAGNTATCSVTINVLGLQPLRPVIDPNPGCAGEIVVLTVDSIAGATYVWTGPKPPYGTTRQITVLNLDASSAGLYTVSAVVNGCATPVDSARVVLATDPDAEDDLEYFIDPLTTDTFPSVLLNDRLMPVGDFSITETSPLDGLTMLPNGTFVFTAGDQPQSLSFIYEVCSKSCPELCDMATVTITVRDTKCSFIPNIITPNGDSFNDYFEIPCVDTGFFNENSLVVYNEWGDKVYEAAPYSNDPANAWNGTLNGEAGRDLPDGVYFYIFKPGPSEAPLKGFVEIFR
jgi:gliding motility-associated-like protein